MIMDAIAGPRPSLIVKFAQLSCLPLGSMDNVKRPVMPRCMSRLSPPDNWNRMYLARRAMASTAGLRDCRKILGEREAQIGTIGASFSDAAALHGAGEARGDRFNFGNSGIGYFPTR